MEAIARQDQEAQSVIKGKRTKRQRPLSPLSLAMPNSSSSSTTSTNHDLHRLAVPSPTSGFTDVSCCTEEEEDMAHCLILLAQGQSGVTQKPMTLGLAVSEAPRNKSFKVVGSDGLLSYQCRTCDRSFPSFQALGGHRASHKIKPRPVPGTEQNGGIILKPNLTSPAAAAAVTLTLQTPNRVNDPTKSKVHECTVCGVEFSSGQALGGHMRRHRTLLTASTATTTTATTSTSTSLDTAGDVFHQEFPKKQRTTQLELDLNLPAAPEEDCRDPKFGFPTAKEQVLMFSASPLVDCCRY